MIRSLRVGAGVLVCLSSVAAASDADACGGCFHPENQPVEQSSVVLAHRMALSISTEASVLWDQVEYTGSPGEFAWVLPVRPGARVEIASDAWFEALDAATAVRVRAPTIQCVTRTTQPGFFVDQYRGYEDYGCQVAPAAALGGCSSDEIGATEQVYVEGGEVTEISDLAPPEEPVSVVHRGSAGPYETVTLHANVDGALTTWLTDHSYAIDAEIQPIIDAYSKEGFDFIALRLLPDVGVQQMKPVRVIQPGAVTTLPLRMVAAGTGANVSMTLFIVAEGAYEAANFINEQRPSAITWSFASASSSYREQRSALLEGKAAWLTAYSTLGALLSAAFDPGTGQQIQYTTPLGFASTIADVYMDQALANGETSHACARLPSQLAYSKERVVDPCPPSGGDCGEVAEGELDARYFECGPLKDLMVAMTGLHPADVWVTRLEAELPRAALDKDLELWPSLQNSVSSTIVASNFTDAPCEVAPASGALASPNEPKKSPNGGGPRSVFLLGAGALALWLMARRIQRGRIPSIVVVLDRR